MQMAATAAAAGVRQHHHAGGGGGSSGTKGVARRHDAMVHEGLRDEGGARVAPGARRLETPLQGWVGQEGGKKSDKTIERNLNYAPRKMAIVCKAMLIRRGRKRADADFADAVRHEAASASSLPPELFVLFLFFPSSVVVRDPSIEFRSPAIASLFYAPCAPFRLLHLSAHFQDAHHPLSSLRSPDLSPRCIYCTYLVQSP